MRNSYPSNNKTNGFQKTNGFRISTVISAAVVALFMVIPANSCPFCSAVARTFTEQIDSSDLVVIACLESEPMGTDRTQLPRAMFKVTKVLKGEDILQVDKEFEAVVVSRKIKIGDQFLVMGNGTDTINWTTPQLVSNTVVQYMGQLDGLPEKGGDRLAFFAEYFEHEEAMLAYDAYDEFARASYADVREMKGRMDSGRLIEWLKDPEVMKSRKRLYYTLLGVCGGKDDLPFLEDIIKSGDRDRQAGLDALIACYLTLTGDEGVPLIEETFLKNPESEFIDVFSAITALRFHGAESDKVSKTRIVEALRYVLDRPKMADMVIPDLARWEDWSVMDRLVQMFKESDTDETRWVRTPIISYLQACPKEEAKACIAELREIDPNAAKRADMLAELDWGDEDEDEEEEEEDKDGETDSSDEPTDGAKEASGAGATTDKGKSGVEKSDEGDEGGDGLVDIYDDGPANTNPAKYVSTNDVQGATNLRKKNGSGNEQLAQRTSPAPPVAIIMPTSPSTLIMLLAGIGICAILFLLLWSVLNGTFERLIS